MTEAVVSESRGIEEGNRCSLSSRLAEELEKEPGSHIKVEGGLKAYFVVDEIRGGDESEEVWVSVEGLDRIKSESGQQVEISATVPDSSYAEAWKTAGFYESLLESEGSDVFISCPHGGDAEKNTDVMGRHLCQMLWENNVGASAWLCQGFDSGYDGKDSYSRWHLRKPVKAFDAYPRLESVRDRRFDYVVGFHLQQKDYSTVMVGGQASDDLRRAVAESLQEKLGSYADVEWRYSEFALTGRGDKNSVNYFTKDGQGLQIEMPPKVCRNKFKAVPRAVRNVLTELL
ncbi:poly-gamma-glutamate hydrolase family protein [Haloplanus natans]|uniref:poly-gamma-glutamate hydrolase family protein n=1 Tax=Haloplanus natans TaxID=376171 RepID=UPI0006782129|nr:poly-gamma-glutamate hydrolase family protein [Haloplanus natans]